MQRGYRGWKVRMHEGKPILVSPSHANRIWHPGENTACCNICEDGPGEKCGCGFYSLKSPTPELIHYGSDIIGQVLVYGRMEEGELGYRSKYAQVNLLLLPSIEPLSEEVIEQLRFKYNVALVKAEGNILNAICLERKKRLIARGGLRMIAAMDEYRLHYAWKNKRVYSPEPSRSLNIPY